jgi:hypothetical protein
MKIRTVGKLALVGLFLFSLSGCQSTLQCGDWVFTGTPGDLPPLSAGSIIRHSYS